MGSLPWKERIRAAEARITTKMEAGERAAAGAGARPAGAEAARRHAQPHGGVAEGAGARCSADAQSQDLNGRADPLREPEVHIFLD